MLKNERNEDKKIMNENKIIALSKAQSHIGIHTANGITYDTVDLVKANAHNMVRTCNKKEIGNKNGVKTYIRVNPNKDRNGYIIPSYSEFQEVMQKLYDDIGITNFNWNRVDLSFNTMENSFYADYTKLNRLLIACFAKSTNDYNTYDTRNFWTGREKSLATKNDYRDIEFYDKNDEAQGHSPYYSRLELRSKKMRKDIKTEFMSLWFERLDNAVKEFEAIQDKFNFHMSELYLEDMKKPKREREFLSLNSFLMTRKGYIFTSTQMKKLLMLIGLDENAARNKAYNFKKNHKIEYFKKEDLEAIVADIKSKIIEYFSK